MRKLIWHHVQETDYIKKTVFDDFIRKITAYWDSEKQCNKQSWEFCSLSEFECLLYTGAYKLTAETKIKASERLQDIMYIYIMVHVHMTVSSFTLMISSCAFGSTANQDSPFYKKLLPYFVSYDLHRYWCFDVIVIGFPYTPAAITLKSLHTIYVTDIQHQPVFSFIRPCYMSWVQLL